MIKLLYIFQSHKGGLQYHHIKNEVGLILSGSLLVRTGDTVDNLKETILGPGALFAFPPGRIHQEEAMQNTIVLEISSPHLNDRVRIDSDSEGLPSTLISDVLDLDQSISPETCLEKAGFTNLSDTQLRPEISKVLEIYLDI